jgi:hypothetical protein
MDVEEIRSKIRKEIKTVSKKLRAASIMLYIVSGVAVLSGLKYIFSSRMMPYHEAFLGMTQEQLDPKVAEFILLQLKGAGAACLSIAVALAMLVKGPFSKGDIWAWWIILIMPLLSLVPLMVISLKIGVSGPWWVIGIAVILVIAAAAISKSECKRIY